jgi:hypothetical protein
MRREPFYPCQKKDNTFFIYVVVMAIIALGIILMPLFNG